MDKHVMGEISGPSPRWRRTIRGRETIGLIRSRLLQATPHLCGEASDVAAKAAMDVGGWSIRDLNLSGIPAADRDSILSHLDQMIIAFAVPPYRREAGLAAIEDLMGFLADAPDPALTA